MTWTSWISEVFARTRYLNTYIYNIYIFIYIYDGSSKVLFPLLALNRNSMRDAFAVNQLVLKKKGSFPAKRASAHPVVCTKDLRGDTESSKNECHCDFFTAPWYKLMLPRCGTPSPLWPSRKLALQKCRLWMATMGQVQKQASYWIFASGKLAPKTEYQNAEKQKRNSSSSSSSNRNRSSSLLHTNLAH